jgi:hypothetical protein
MTDDSVRMVTRSEEAADIAVGSAQIAQKAAKKVMDALPRPDVRDNIDYQRLVGQEQSWLARLSPRRNRWKAIAAFDERVAACDRRQEELNAERADLRAQVAGADDAHADAVAQWMHNGQSGPKPVSAKQELEAAVADCDAESAAVGKLLERILVERMQYVVAHRSALTRDADKDVQRALNDLLAHIGAIGAKRDALAEAAATARWAKLYPSDQAAASVGSEAHLALGLMVPVKETLGVSHTLPITAVIEALQRDARVVAERLTPEQRRELGTAPTPTPEGEALWHSSDEYQAYARDKQRELNDMARSALPVDLPQLAAEMRDE